MGSVKEEEEEEEKGEDEKGEEDDDDDEKVEEIEERGGRCRISGIRTLRTAGFDSCHISGISGIVGSR